MSGAALTVIIQRRDAPDWIYHGYSMRFVTLPLIGALAISLYADEGMWPFNQFPTDAVKQKHGFAVTNDFLNNLRLASVRIGGGSGSFVSPGGLLLTTQHIASGCLLNITI